VGVGVTEGAGAVGAWDAFAGAADENNDYKDGYADLHGANLLTSRMSAECSIGSFGLSITAAEDAERKPRGI
jgi:hypothetical protein